MHEIIKKRTAHAKLPAAAVEQLRSVLVALDLTAASKHVLGRLALLPLAEDAHVRLLHVVPGGLARRDTTNAEDDAEKVLARAARRLKKSVPRGARVETIVKVGSAAQEIVACAVKVKADLIVVGRGGPRLLRDAFLGSTAERVARQARLPVLVVRRPPRAPYARPAIALALDEAVERILRLLLLLVPAPLSRVAVIHAFDAPYQNLVYPSLPKHEAAARKAELRRHATERLRGVLAAALGKLGIPPAAAPVWRSIVRYGPPRSVVERAVNRMGADLLVLGTHAHGPAAQMFLGTVAGDLLRAAPCDVLVVPPIRPHQ